MSQQRTESAMETRQALILTGLQLFGEKGFAATTTREIAAAAGANIGSISYHFGGKEGLHAACAEFIVATMRSVVGEIFDIDAPDAETGLKPEEARRRLSQLSGIMIEFLAARPEAELIAPFILREMTHPTDALQTIYGQVIEPVHKRLCRVWADATGMGYDDPRTLLSVFAVIGQVVYFRLAREIVLKRMGWSELGDSEAGEIAAVLERNLAAIVERAPG